MSPAHESVAISVVVPVYSGQEYLEELVGKLAAVREEWKNRSDSVAMVEAIFVSDAAIDNSSDVLQALAAKHDWIQNITLARNFGQHPATVAGILHTCGDWVFTIDEDLQHDPEHFLTLLVLAVTEELDVVYARPQASVHKSIWRDQGSIQFKKMLSAITGNKHIQSFNSFRLVRGSIARAVASVCSHETYFDIALCWFTGRIGEKLLPLHDRRFASTKRSGYNLFKLFEHARRMVISSPAKVLRLGAFVGILANIGSIVFACVILILKLIDPQSIQVTGWTSTVLIVVFFGGLTSFLLGVNLEYITNVLLHSQGKPSFFLVDRSSDAVVRATFQNGKS